MSSSRGGRAATAVALGLAAAGLGFPSPAPAAGPGAPVHWVFTDSAEPVAVSPDPAGDVPLGSSGDPAGVVHTRRAYFSYDLTGLNGQALHAATFSSAETSVADCGTTAPIEVWRTGPVTSGTTWSAPPSELELLRRAEYGKGLLCPGAYLGVDVLGPVEAALARHDRTITFEVRIGAAAEQQPGAARSMRPFRLTVGANHVPVVGGPGLRAPDRSCGTPGQPVPAGGHTTFGLHVTDADGGEPAGVTFALWPVEHPDQRRQFTGSSGADPTGLADLSAYPEGTVLAWSGQARDAADTSAVSGPCYLTVDNTAPGTPPVVGSARHDRPPSPCRSGQGAAGDFLLDASGDRDTVAFAWHDDRTGRTGVVAARRPGGRARLAFGPDLVGNDALQVSAVDAAGNRGPATPYDFCVPGPGAPSGDAPAVGPGRSAGARAAVAGRPSAFSLTPRRAGVVAYLYDFGDGNRQRIAAGPGGVATLKWIPSRAGDYTLTAWSVTADGALSQPQRADVPVIDDHPALWSEGGPADVGRPAHVTVSSDLPGVRQYRYSVDGGPERAVRYTYQAVLPIVPAHAGATVVTARAQLADGTFSPASSLSLPVSSAPLIEPVPALGAAAIAQRICTVRLSPARPEVAGYRYTFDGSAGEQSVPAGADGRATVEFAPDQPGWRVLTAVSVGRDGSVSAPRAYPVRVADPQVRVTSSWDGPGPALGAGDPGTFRFDGDLAGQTAEYLWHLDDGPVRTGTSTEVAYTPQRAGASTLSVQRKFRDGTLSPVTDYHFEVGTLPRVVADPASAATGRVTTLVFSGGRPGVVSFDYQITRAGDGAVDGSGTVLTDRGGSAQITFVPPAAGGYRVIVTGHTAGGTPTGTTTYPLTAS